MADLEKSASDEDEEDVDDEDDDQGVPMEEDNVEAVKYIQVESAFEPGRVVSTTLWSSAEERQLWLKQIEEAKSTSKIAYLLRAITSRCGNLRSAK